MVSPANNKEPDELDDVAPKPVLKLRGALLIFEYGKPVKDLTERVVEAGDHSGVALALFFVKMLLGEAAPRGVYSF